MEQSASDRTTGEGGGRLAKAFYLWGRNTTAASFPNTEAKVAIPVISRPHPILQTPTLLSLVAPRASLMSGTLTTLKPRPAIALNVPERNWLKWGEQDPGRHEL